MLSRLTKIRVWHVLVVLVTMLLASPPWFVLVASVLASSGSLIAVIHVLCFSPVALAAVHCWHLKHAHFALLHAV